MSWKIVALGDMHLGSRVSLAAPDGAALAKDEGLEVRQALFKEWKAAATGKWAKPDVLIANGDLIDGPNRKRNGFGCWTTDMTEQADQAVELLKMWKAKQYVVVRGSDYHVAAGGSLPVEEYLARQLPGATDYPQNPRNKSGWHWYLTFDDLTMHVSHKISVSKVFHYQSTPTARQMLQAKLNDALRRSMDPHYKTSLIIRSHAHYYNSVEYSGTQGWVLPCWKALDEFMVGNGPIDISPDLGFVGFTITGGKYTYEKNLFHLEEVQPPPHIVFGKPKRKQRAGSRRTSKGKSKRAS